MIGHTLGGASIAIIQGLLVLVVCFIAGFRPDHLSTVPLALLFMVLIAIVFAGLGTAIGSTLQNMQGFQLIMNFLVMPIFFLSGALFPLNNIPAALAVVTRIDPLTYGIDGLRGAFIGVSHFGLAIGHGDSGRGRLSDSSAWAPGRSRRSGLTRNPLRASARPELGHRPRQRSSAPQHVRPQITGVVHARAHVAEGERLRVHLPRSISAHVHGAETGAPANARTV
jgi:hypothetical protein